MADAPTLVAIEAAMAGHNPKLLDATRRAAIAAVFRTGPTREAEVLLIRRAIRSDDPWSGHMAFPGGRADPTDRSLYDTAVRETREEVGLDLTVRARLIGRLDDISAVAHGRPAGLVVSSFVVAVDEGSELRLVPNAEVDEALWAPIGPLVRGERDTEQAYVMEGRSLRLPAYDVDGRIVWGLTYFVLRALFARLR